MKVALLFLSLVFSGYAFSQVNYILPSEAKVFYENVMFRIKPEVKILIEKNANKLTGRKINVDSLLIDLKKSPVLNGGNESDLQAIAVLILVKASQNADTNLKELVINKRQTNRENANDAEKERDKNYAILLVETKSDIAQTVSFMMTKFAHSQETVLDKFK